MRKKKSVTKTSMRLAGLIIFSICMYNDNIGAILWFLLGCGVVFWVIPYLLTEIIFTDIYDGTFLIDETEPTDVKFKLTFDTDPEILANCEDMIIKIDHREPRESNIGANGGDLNGKG